MADLTYVAALRPVLERALATQHDIVLEVAARMAQVIAGDHLVYVFGVGHAGIVAEEMVYRAGGLVPINPIFGPGLTLDTRPLLLETDLERLSGYATLLLNHSGAQAGDMMIVHSNSGRNTVAIEMAEEAQRRGLVVVALVNVAQCTSIPSRHPRGIRLVDVADYVIDNCGVIGDAAVTLPGLAAPVGATSTVVGATLMNAVVVEATRMLLEQGIDPPITLSANIDGSDAHNQRVWAQYRGRLTYL